MIERVRRDTPACARLAHFNNAGMSLTPQPVLNTVFRHLGREQGMGGYRAEAHIAERLDAGYGSVARLVGADASEIAFMANATRAWEIALASLDLQPGDRVVAHASEYVSNRFSLMRLQRRGVAVDMAASRPDGTVDPDSVADLVGPRTRAVCITHVPSTLGIVNPAAEIGAVTRESDALYMLDACQSAGQLHLDVDAIGCDILAATGRKFLRGPRGTGFLYVRGNVLDRLDPVFPDYRSARFSGPDNYRFVPGARRFETYEHSVAAKLGFIRAVDYALEIGLPAIEGRVRELSTLLRNGLRDAGMDVLAGDAQTSGIVVFTHPAVAPAAAKTQLAEQSINVSVSTRDHQAPHAAIRASVHYYNTPQEIDRLAHALAAMVTGG